MFLSRWHPKIALRYLPIVDEIRRLGGEKYSVLEVGSGSLGIAPYLGKKVTGVDIDFSGPSFPLLQQVKADATVLPFASQSFDFVVCVDMLEHLAVDKRKKAIEELIRVAKRAIFMGVPTGRMAEKQDKQLSTEYKKKFGKPYPYLEEQVSYGLPKKEEILGTIDRIAKERNRPVTVVTRGNITIHLRYVLMRGWMTKNMIIDLIFRKLLLLFIPLLRLCNWEPTYRTLFFISFRD